MTPLPVQHLEDDLVRAKATQRGLRPHGSLGMPADDERYRWEEAVDS